MFDFILFYVNWMFTVVPMRRLEAARRRSKKLQSQVLDVLARVDHDHPDTALQERGLRLTQELIKTDKEFRRYVDLVCRRRHAAVTVTTAVCKGMITGKYWARWIFWTPLRWLYRI